MRLSFLALTLIIAISCASAQDVTVVKSVLENIIEPGDSLLNANRLVKEEPEDEDLDDSATRYTELTEADFKLVAEELGVELAAIKAVVLIEAGVQMKGFWAPGVPVVNFDKTMFTRFRAKATSSGGAKGETVPKGLSGYGLKEWTQLINARKVNVDAANMGTFWGMFQIGGFNYKRCGCDTVDEFVRRMAESELAQLELFAAFIIKGDMLDDLKKKNWAGFARKYNGAGYAKRGYHTKMAAAYKKFKAAE